MTNRFARFTNLGFVRTGRGAALIGALTLIASCGPGEAPPMDTPIDGQPPESGATVDALRVVSFPAHYGLVGEAMHYRVRLSRAGMASYSLTRAPSGVTVDSAGLISWTPTLDQKGGNDLVLRAEMGADGVEQRFHVEVAAVEVQASTPIDPVDPRGGMVSVDAPLSPLRGAAIQLPPGALAAGPPVALTIASVENAPALPAAAGMGLSPSDLRVVELGPTGLTFSRPVSVYLPVTDAVLAMGKPVVQTYDYRQARWTTVPVLTVDTEHHVAVASVSHFSTYAVTPSTPVFAPRVIQGGPSCAGSVIVAAGLARSFSMLPASSVNGAASGASTVAEVLQALPAGQALQLYTTLHARTRDGTAEENHWRLAFAKRLPSGNFAVSVIDDAHPAQFLTIPAELSPTDPELEAWLGGGRVRFVLGSLGAGAATGIDFTAEASLYVVSASDAARAPSETQNALGVDQFAGDGLMPRPGDDDDCDGAPNPWDAEPHGPPPPVLVADPSGPVHVVAGGAAKLTATVTGAAPIYSWSADDASLGVVPSADGHTAAIMTSVPGVFHVAVSASLAGGQTSASFTIFVDPVGATNTPPRVQVSASAAVVRAGDPVSLGGVGHDAEQSPAELHYRWSAAVSGTDATAALSGVTGSGVVFTGTMPGEYTVSCTANDGIADSQVATALITVVPANLNRAPDPALVTPLGGALEHAPGDGVTLVLDAHAIDPDGDAVSYDYAVDAAAPKGFTLARSGSTATFATSTDGVYQIYVTATDVHGLSGPAVAARIVVLPTLPPMPVDADHDGYPAGPDCDDHNPAVHPFAVEVCGDAIDKNCDGVTPGPMQCDADGDHFSITQGDCDDRNPAIFPGAAERCDGLDNNCNGMTDEGFAVGATCSSGVGACAATGKSNCDQAHLATVCDAVAHMPTAEVCDGVDNDCNNKVDDVPGGMSDLANCGGCGVACPMPSNTVPACTKAGCVAPCAPGFFDANASAADGCECSQTNGGVEICDGIDNNCDGVVDENTSHFVYSGPPGTRGIGICTDGLADCKNGQPYSVRSERTPEAEICDGLDNDCNGKVDEGGVCVVPDLGMPRDAGSTDAGACSAQTIACPQGDGGSGCVDPRTDPVNCGACGQLCSTNHVLPSCAAGSCAAGVCLPGFDDCNGDKASDGCEVETRFDVSNCGACGKSCPTPTSGVAGCMAGRCVVAGCLPGARDCDGVAANGCEVNTDGDTQNCGGCSQACGLVAHGAPGCRKGACFVSSCDFGYADCDQLAVSGCETGTQADLSNCGACGATCAAPPHATAACATGKCVIGQCLVGNADCNGLPGDGCETSLVDDVANCGGCGFGCPSPTHGAAACVAGTCLIASCSSPFADCDGDPRNGCETDTSSSVTSCGKCGAGCAMPVGGTASCDRGLCGVGKCFAGRADCNGVPGDGCEVDLPSDVKNCGACQAACPTPANGASACLLGACVVAACGAPFADCDGDAKNGCETDTSQTVASCGGCGQTCLPPDHATPRCAAGKCGIQQCSAGYADCDGSPINGCEVKLDSDAGSCGSCGAACPAPTHGAPACVRGACAIGSCGAPFADCDGSVKNGCETDLSSTIASCGACGKACPTPAHATPKCSTGLCGIAQCEAGFSDCNGDPSDGCEVFLAGDLANCGVCGVTCKTPANGVAICDKGTCNLGGCTAPWADCDGDAKTGCETDTSTGVTSCGACGKQCPPLAHATTKCTASQCAIEQCEAGWADCNGSATDGCEANLGSDVSHCGACPNACPTPANGIAACVVGGCVVGACGSPFADCDGDSKNGCETDTSQAVTDCGACGRACSLANGVAICASGACRLAGCNLGFADCDGSATNGCEVDTRVAADSCGSCGAACSTNFVLRSCSNSSCDAGKCSQGHADCNADKRLDGCEVDVVQDVANCGGCGNACPTPPSATSVCGGGSCVIASCALGTRDCDGMISDGCEVDAQSDVLHCGACNNVCAAIANGSAACSLGVCGLGSCDAGHADCDGLLVTGCEADTQSDVANCGGCKVACPTSPHATAVCAAASCAMGQCDAGWIDCNAMSNDGCEVDSQNDAGNCGSCGSVCTAANGSATCTGGVCVVAACVASFGDCDGKAATGCETDLANDSGNCGACGNVCPTGQRCHESTCQVPPVNCLIDSDCHDGNICQVGDCVAPAVCPTGTFKCPDGGVLRCTNTQSDQKNCGGCHIACPLGQICSSGACLSPPPQCALDVDCRFGNVCQAGQCVAPGACPAGVVLCTDVTSGKKMCSDGAVDPINCGACGHPCQSGQACTAGVCGAAPPACKLDTDCTPGSVCQAGQCVPRMVCPPAMATCMDPLGKKYCVNPAVDALNCGGCGITCLPGQPCSNGTCQAGVVPGCKLDTDCPAGAVCQAGQCVPRMVCPPAMATCMDPLGKKYCVNPAVDALNCGGCGITCLPGQPCSNGTCQAGVVPGCKLDTDCPTGAVCQAGQCVPRMVCPPAMATCMDPLGKKYCVNPAVDALNCGGCGITCLPGQPCSNGTCQAGVVPGCKLDTDCPAGAVCQAGQCVPVNVCPPAMATCMDPLGKKYCVNPAVDALNCGGCGITCLPGQPCSNGTCQAGVVPGCKLDTDCPAGAVCQAGQCVPVNVCPPAMATCMDPLGKKYCVNPAVDALNCGGCGITCLPGQPCSNGTCQAAVVPGCKLDTDCPAGAVCQAGQCVPRMVCPPAMATCMDPLGKKYCVNPAVDALNCGGCGITCLPGQPCSNGTCQAGVVPGCKLDTDCPAGAVCQAGQCVPVNVCPPAMATCMDPLGKKYCVNPAVDALNCGGCGITCLPGQPCSNGTCQAGVVPGCKLDTDCPAGAVCQAGQCVPVNVCPPAMATCMDPLGKKYCVNPAVDALNCGGCGITCLPGQPCSNGTCQAAVVPGCKLDTDCPAGAVCQAGKCVAPINCAPPTIACVTATGFTTCTDLNQDPMNCGFCGTTCAPGQPCINGTCQAAVVPGCKLDSDCPAGAVCQSGKCVAPVNCPSGTSTCVDALGKPFCTDLASDPSNCGVCNLTCGAVEICAAGACTIKP